MVSSVIGETGGIGQVNYASAKAGLFGLTKTLAREAAMQLQRAGHTDGIGVTVNAVTPGYTATEMLDTVPEKVLDGAPGEDPARPAGRAGGGRPRGALPGRGCLRVHHRSGLGSQRRPGHVGRLQRPSVVDHARSGATRATPASHGTRHLGPARHRRVVRKDPT